MKICEKLKSIFKSSNENKKAHDGKLVFGNITDKELVSLSVDKLKNKGEKEKKKMMKEIQTLSKKQIESKYDEISKGMKFFKELSLDRKLGGNLTVKYNFLYDCLKEYHEELKKELDKS